MVLQAQVLAVVNQIKEAEKTTITLCQRRLAALNAVTCCLSPTASRSSMTRKPLFKVLFESRVEKEVT